MFMFQLKQFVDIHERISFRVFAKNLVIGQQVEHLLGRSFSATEFFCRDPNIATL